MNTIPIVDIVATGKNILMLREQVGMTVKDLQCVFGFASPQAIYKWQNGQTLPSLDNLLILADVFNVRIDDIVVKK